MAGNQTASAQISEWNAGNLEMMRINQILEIIDACVIQIGQRDNSALERYFSGLQALWHNIKPYIDAPPLRDGMDASLDNVRKKLNEWLGLPDYKQGMFQFSIAQDLGKIHDELMEMRHNAGLGIRTYRRQSPDDKLKESLHLK